MDWIDRDAKWQTRYHIDKVNDIPVVIVTLFIRQICGRKEVFKAVRETNREIDWVDIANANLSLEHVEQAGQILARWWCSLQVNNFERQSLLAVLHYSEVNVLFVIENLDECRNFAFAVANRQTQ